jgi:hypothetical protein
MGYFLENAPRSEGIPPHPGTHQQETRHARVSPSIIELLEFSTETVQVRVREYVQRLGSSIGVHHAVYICLWASLCPPTSQDND